MQNKALTKLFNNFGQKLLQNQELHLTLDKGLPIRSRSVGLISMFFTRPKFYHSLLRSLSLVKPDKITAPCFSTSTKKVQLNSENVSSKINQDIFPQIQSKFFTHRAEEETIEVEGVGWAGQPIVKRLHTILPEVHGDIPDIIKATKASKAISEVGNNLDVRVRSFGRSHDIIAVINENAQNKMNENLSVTGGRRLHTRKAKVYYQHSGISTKNPLKLKKKKRTVVLASKPATLLRKKRNTKSKKTLMINKNHGIQTSLVLNRRFSKMPLLTFDPLQVPNRQFKTSALDYAKPSVAVKLENKVPKLTLTGQSKKERSTKTAAEPMIPADDCVCPEILYTTGIRKSTKICGEAAGARKEKKKSSWKQKMCRVEPREDPGRQKTLVCLSEAAKQGKRKKELKKCPEPEKKIAPRVIICEPNLEEEEEAKKKKKECVKIEEVKIRKRTKVCKPVVIFAKEEVGIKVEKKAVCSSTRIKKVVSKHTKICPPLENK